MWRRGMLLLLTTSLFGSALLASPSSAQVATPGERLWVARHEGSSQSSGGGSVAVSPDGSTVFVTGSSSQGSQESTDVATIAYDAVTGAELWAQRYNGPDSLYDDAYALAVSRDGSVVFVTGGSNYAYVTIAYRSTTGAKLWARHYRGPGPGSNTAFAIDVSPDGTSVYVTGASSGAQSGWDYATIAYDAETGTQAWVRRYNSRPSGEDIAYAVRVSPDGSRVFVTGDGDHFPNDDFVTIAYEASTGSRIWQRQYNGPVDGFDEASALAVSPDGNTVIVTGQSYGVGVENDDWATIAYDAATGEEIWSRRHEGRGNDDDIPTGIAVSPDGTTVFVAGYSQEGLLYGFLNWITMAYDMESGRTVWFRRVDGSGGDSDTASDLAVSPDGSMLFVVGGTAKGDSANLTTVAYAMS